MAGTRSTQTDVAVGQRIGAFRTKADLSQTELADRIGVTFQRVQKYENGMNQVGAGRHTMIARALDVSITAFFEGLPRQADMRRDDSARAIELGSMPAAPKFLKEFSEIFDAVIETEVVELVRALSYRRGH